MIKKYRLKNIVVAAILLPQLVMSVFADDILIRYSGVYVKNSLVSLMAVKQEADYDNLKDDDVVDVVIAETDKNGAYSADLELDDVNFDENGNIVNYKLNSNIDGIDINSGEIIGRTTVLKNIYVDENGVPYVPVVETFDKFGVSIKEESDEVWTGIGINGKIKIEAGKNSIEVDWVDIELDGKVKYIEGILALPLAALEPALKCQTPQFFPETLEARIVVEESDFIPQNEFNIEAAVKNIPDGIGTVVADNNSLMKAYVATGTDKVRKEKITETVNGQRKKILRLTVSDYEYFDYPYNDIQVGVPVSADILKNETALMSFKARCVSEGEGTGDCVIRMEYFRTEDWKGNLLQDVIVKTGEWQQFYLPMYSWLYDVTVDAGAQACIKIGGKEKCIDITDFSIVNYKTDVAITDLNPTIFGPYKGIEDDALWRKEAYKRIEKYRKGDVSIIVRDENGNPVKNAEISIKQTDSDFLFGLGLQKSDILNLDTTTLAGQKKDALYSTSFNSISCGTDLKGHDITMNDGEAGIDVINDALRRGLRARGHTLMWDIDDFCGAIKNHKALSYEELYKRVKEYVVPVAYTYRGKLEQWDALNEPLECSWIRRKYGTRMYSDMFKEVRKVDPYAKLYVNETGMIGLDSEDEYDKAKDIADLVYGMQLEGAEVDGIGIQAHCSQYRYPQGFYRQLDTCASVVDEVAVTEYEMSNSNTEYADEHLRDYLIATYSHPKATGFIIYNDWNLCAPFFDDEWNEKPAKLVWDRMVNEEFKTKLTVVTDENGKASFRGFYGDYEIAVVDGSLSATGTFKLSKDVENKITITSGDSIKISVSKDIEPSKGQIEYNFVSEARKELEEMSELSYEGIVLESNFKDIDTDVFKTGNSVSNNENYNENGYWGSYTGSDGGIFKQKYGVMLKGNNFGMKQKIEGQLYNNVATKVELGVITEGEGGKDFSVDILLEGESFEQSLMIFGREQGSYFVSTFNGEKTVLLPNQQYSLTAVIEKDGKTVSYYIKGNDDLIQMSDCLTDTIDKTLVKNGALNVSAEEKTDNLATLFNFRISYATSEELILFEDSSYDIYTLNDSLKDFSYSNCVASDMDEKYISGEVWARVTATENAGSEAYLINKDYTNGITEEYLWALRYRPRGKQSIGHKFLALAEGESLRTEFDLYLNVPTTWYSSPMYCDLVLCDDAESKSVGLFKFAFKTGDGHYLSFLNKDGNAFSSENKISAASRFNKRNINVVIEFTPNALGNYDATITATNEYGEKIDAVVENMLTKAEIGSLNTVKFSSETTSAGLLSENGKSFCGIKNIAISKKGKETVVDINGYKTIKANDNMGIKYQNITEKPFSAIVILAGYDNDNRLEGISAFEYSGIDEINGSLNFRADMISDINKVFLFKGLDTMMPYKSGEVLKGEKELLLD